MLNYILSTSQDESKPKAAQLLIQELIQAFPEEPERGSVMTFAQQLKQEGLQQGFEKGKRAEALIIARNMLAKGLSLGLVKEITKLPDLELIEVDEAS